MTLTIGTDGAGLRLEVRLKPEVRAALDTDPGPDYPPADIGLLPGDGDEYVVTSGGLKGQRGFFTRDERGAVVGVDLAGRLFNRVPADAAVNAAELRSWTGEQEVSSAMTGGPGAAGAPHAFTAEELAWVGGTRRDGGCRSGSCAGASASLRGWPGRHVGGYALRSAAPLAWWPPCSTRSAWPLGPAPSWPVRPAAPEWKRRQTAVSRGYEGARAVAGPAASGVG